MLLPPEFKYGHRKNLRDCVSTIIVKGNLGYQSTNPGNYKMLGTVCVTGILMSLTMLVIEKALKKTRLRMPNSKVRQNGFLLNEHSNG